MKAVVVHNFGGPEVLRYIEVPDPIPNSGEALVRVLACGVTRLDVDIRSGRVSWPIRLPHILGRDMAGVVVEENGNSGLALGSRVVAPLHISCMSPQCPYCRTGRDNICPRRRHPGVDSPGNYAEYAVYPAQTLIPLPNGLDFVGAVAGLQTFSTAWHVMERVLEVRAGESVLITGAGGGVGTSLVKVAELMGARVLAAASGRKTAALRRAFPGVEVIDYTDSDWSRLVRGATGDEGVDAVAEVVGGAVFSEALKTLKPDGRLAVVGAHGGSQVMVDLIDLFRAQHRILGSSAYSHSDVAQAMALMASGTLAPVIGATLQLPDAAEAHRLMEAHDVIGKVVLKPDVADSGRDGLTE